MAGTIEDLNFKVILDDKDFNERIKSDINMAERLNTSLSKILSIKLPSTRQIISDKGVTNAESVAKSLESIRRSLDGMPEKVQVVSSRQQQHRGAVEETNASYYRMGNILRTVSQLTGAAFSVVGLRRFLSALIDITGQFEVQRMALRSMLKDIDGADKIFEDLYRFSSDSTYRFSELAKYAKQLAAFQIGKDSLLETTKMLGDVASGVGVSMDRLILAYGHVKSSGFLRGIQLRSFSQNGVPILEELSKMFTEIEGKAVSLGDVFDKMTKRKIPFEMVEEAFKRMTSEGGQFYQMQEVLAKTLAGQINILKGRWENLLAKIGEGNSGVLKDTVSWISELISNTDNIGRLFTEIIVGLGAYKAAMIAAAVVTKGFGAAMLDVGVALEKFYLKLIKNPYAILATAIAATAVAIYQFNTALSDSEKIQMEAEKSIHKFNSELAAENAELERLYARLNLAKKGTEEYDMAKRAIESRFGPYIAQLREEGKAVDDLATIYGDLATKIRESIKSKFLESASSALSTQLKNATDNIYASFEKTAKLNNWTIAQQEDIWRYITTGEIKDNGNINLFRQSGGGTIGLPGTFLYKDMGRSAYSLRADMERAMSSFNSSMNEIEKMFSPTGGGSGSGGGGIKELDYDIKNIIEEIKTLDDEITRIRNKAKNGTITAAEKQQLDELIKDRDANLKLYKDIMGIDYAKSVREETKEENAAIRSIKQKISVLEKYKSIYDRVSPIKGDETASWMASVLGGDASDYQDLDGQIKPLIADLRSLGNAGNEAAEAIEARLGLDAVSQLVKADKAAKEAAKAMEEYEKFLRVWSGKDFNLGGSGTTFDLRKILSDYNTNLGKVDEEFTQGVLKAQKVHEGNAKAIEEETKKLAKLRDAEKAYYKAIRDEKVRDLAKKIFDEQMQGFDLSNWGDKSLSQIEEIREALVNVDVPEGIRKELEADEQLLQALINELKRLAQATIDKTVDPEKWKKVANQAKYIAARFIKVAESLKAFGEASGNRNLVEAADTVGRIAQNVKAAEEGAKAWGGWWGAIIGGATDLFTQIIDAITETEEKASELRETLRDTFRDSQISNFKNELDKAGKGLFGEDALAQLNLAIKKYREAMGAIADLQSIVAGNIRVTAGGGGVYSMFTRDYNSFTKESDMWSLERISKETGIKMLDDYGNINVELLQWIRNAGWELTEEEKKWLNEAEVYVTQYAESMKVIEDMMDSLFGDIASDAADMIIDSWIEAGNAALDYADILDDVSKAYAKMLIQSMITENFLDPITQDVKDAFMSGDFDTAMTLIAGAMQGISDSAPMFENILSSLDSYFSYENGDSGNSLGNGIKSITENTASLLASYINAMRADLSVIRGLQEKGLSSFDLIGESIPALNDYLNQVAANTYDMAQTTHSILSELQSVIGAEGSSGSIVRVEMVR